MRNYIVCDSPDPAQYSACVMAVGPSLPLEELEGIVEDLRANRAAGCVVFDLFVANASRLRRYTTVNFDGEKFEPFQFEKILGDDALRRHSAALLMKHLPRLNMLMMTPAQRFAVSKGMVI